jgi:hypothetical protein
MCSGQRTVRWACNHQTSEVVSACEDYPTCRGLSRRLPSRRDPNICFECNRAQHPNGRRR